MKSPSENTLEMDVEIAAERLSLVEQELAMMAAMGIPTGFATTQGKEVDDPNCNLSAVHKKSTRQARQYMNRRGGFNRPLPAEVTGQKVNTD